MLCTQVKKISDFTEKLVKQLRAQTKALQVKVTADKGHQQNDELMRVSILIYYDNPCCLYTHVEGSFPFTQWSQQLIVGLPTGSTAPR